MKLDHPFHGNRILPGKRLIHQDIMLAAHELLGDSHALALTAGELCRIFIDMLFPFRNV